MKNSAKKPYQFVSYEWLSRHIEEQQESARQEDFDTLGWINYPIPADVGHGGYESVDLTLGMTIVHSALTFSPAMQGKSLKILDVEARFEEISFQAMSLRGLHGIMQEHFPDTVLSGSSGIDIFRHTAKYHSIFTVDTSFSGQVFHVSLGRTILDRLVGSEISEQLLDTLNLASPPSVSAHPVPLQISNLLFKGLNPALTGSARNLFCQAQVLGYLSGLVTHFLDKNVPQGQTSQAKKRASMLYEYLIDCTGKLPSLDELSIIFGRSANLLNTEFSQEFGMPIHTFMADHRLNQAHAALTETSIPIKSLAASLGYSHVSNFTIAFKRKFGYPPGSLRKN